MDDMKLRKKEGVTSFQARHRTVALEPHRYVSVAPKLSGWRTTTAQSHPVTTRQLRHIPELQLWLTLSPISPTSVLHWTHNRKESLHVGAEAVGLSQAGCQLLAAGRAPPPRPQSRSMRAAHLAATDP